MTNFTRVWLVRHGETATPHVFHGAESDEPLSAHGRRQAQAAAEWFRQFAPQVVITSAMRRAVHTGAAIAAACGIPLLQERRLHERRCGDLSGTPFALDNGPWIETTRQWAGGNTAYTTPGAEPYDAIRDRVLPVWERLMTEHAGRRIVIVAHGIVCKILPLTVVPGWGPTRWHDFGKVANLAVSELSLSSAGEWQLHRIIEVPPPVRLLDEAAATTGLAKSMA